MAWRFVKQPNGLLARFSEVVDDFTDYDMTQAEAIDLACDKMGRGDAITKVQNAIEDRDPYSNTPGDGSHRWNEAIESITIAHGIKRARLCTKQMS